MIEPRSLDRSHKFFLSLFLYFPFIFYFIFLFAIFKKYRVVKKRLDLNRPTLESRTRSADATAQFDHIISSNILTSFATLPILLLSFCFGDYRGDNDRKWNRSSRYPFPIGFEIS